MAIRGRLDELPASEVVQFLTQTGRSGTLRFQDGRWQKFIAFENGRLIYAVSQHRLAPLAEILYQWGIRDRLEEVEDADRLEQQLATALEWRRSEAGVPSNEGMRESRLGRLLVARKLVDQDALTEVLRPEALPDGVLAASLLAAGILTEDGVDAVRREGDESLFEAVCAQQLATEDQVAWAVRCMPERILATLLVDAGLVSEVEAEFCVEQLDALQRDRRRQILIGQFLVATGAVSPEQLEDALVEQVTRPQLLGEILVERGVLDAAQIDAAAETVASLRLAFAPLRALRKVLEREDGLPSEDFAAIRAEHRNSESLLAQLLVETRRIAEADLRSRIEGILADELSDLTLWQEGSYEFFEGFTLADALGEAGLDRLHNFSFEAGSLLLDAHYRVDELARSSFRRFGPHTVFVAQATLGEECEVSPEELRLMDRMNGRRSLGEVCAVLPGTLLTGRLLVTRLLDNGWISPVSRQESCDAGHAALAAGDAESARAMFRHALRATGDGPEDAEIRLWLEEAQIAGTRAWVHRYRLAARWAGHRIAQARGTRAVVGMLRRQEFLARPARATTAAIGSGWARLRQARRRMAMTCQDFLLQKGLTRRWWNLQRRLGNPKVLVQDSRCQAVVGLVAVGVAAAVLIPGITTLEPPRDRPPATQVARTSAKVRTPAIEVPMESPVQEGPEFIGESMLVVARDGFLRRIALATGAVEWERSIGEFGDRLSSPRVFGQTAFVTNSRGSVHAVTLDGEPLWREEFPRVECLAPVLALGPEQNLQGVVVAARESLLVLHPEDGRTLYRFQCGNVIRARPLVDGDRVWVGSTDNHVYCADWRRKLVLWDVEVGADVASLVRSGTRLVVRLNRGRLVALERGTGQRAWQFGDETKKVRAMRALAGGRLAVELTNGGAEVGEVATGAFLECVRPLQPGANAQMLVTDARRFYYTDVGTLGEIDLRGDNLWRCEKRLPGMSGLHCAGDRLVVTGSRGLWIFKLGEVANPEDKSDD